MLEGSLIQDVTLEDVEAKFVKWRCSSKDVNLNVGGDLFKLEWNSMRKVRRSTLAKLADSKTSREFLTYCDSYNISNNEVIFERRCSNFALITQLYQFGIIHITSDVKCQYSFPADLDYWGIEESNFGRCCQGKLRKLEIAMEDEDDEEEHAEVTQTNSLWQLFNDPGSSSWAFAIEVFSFTCIALSILQMTLETEPGFRKSDWRILHEYKLFFIMETVYTIYFIIELGLRFFSCPSKRNFVKGFMNWIDFLAILPFFIPLTLALFSVSYEASVSGGLLKLLRCVRVLRMMRIFTKAQNNEMRAFGLTIKQNFITLALLGVLIFMGTMIFGALVFYTETRNGRESDKFHTMLDGYWWAIITMTTVGFGDTYPETSWGRVVGSACSLFGILMIALPVGIIGNDFVDFFEDVE